MDVDDTSRVTRPTNERYTAVVIDKAEGSVKGATGKVLWTWSGDDATHTPITVRPLPTLPYYRHRQITEWAQLEERVVGLHKVSLTDRPILAIHSATSYTLLTPDESHPPQHVNLATKTEINGEIMASQILLTTPEYTNALLVDNAGHWMSFTLEGSSGSVRAVLQKEGKLLEGKRLFKSASISKDGVITAIGA